MTMDGYGAPSLIPPLVKRASNLAEQMGVLPSCSPQVGRLLQLLTSQMQSGVIGEVGTGCGVASAWIISALASGTSFFSVEGDELRAAAVRALFEPYLNVRIMHGDWREFISHWRFGLLYIGANSGRDAEPDLLLKALRVGGMIVLDGLTPTHKTPLEMRYQADALRDFWLNDTRLISTEIMVSMDESVILATLHG